MMFVRDDLHEDAEGADHAGDKPWDRAMTVWNWMDELGLEKSGRHYYYMVQMLCRKGDVNDAVKLREEMFEEGIGGDQNVDTVLAGYLADEGRWEELEDLIDDGFVILD
jgi:pentatricopeptide repeat protein